MIRLIYATIVGLIGAGVVHLAIVFLLPWLSANTAWNAVAAMTIENEPLEIRSSGDPRAEALTRGLDPYFRKIVCRYDLSSGAARIYATERTPLWTASVHDPIGASFFSLNDRISVGKLLDLTVVNSRQLRFVRQNTPDVLSNSVVVPADGERGFVVVRVFVPDDSWDPVANRFVASIACDTLEF